ncbi:hypothetical protein GQ42DRAFT_160252 [Ramicandelaber brevisporus]|nr:hypothetical protein GQ42DRAFT_160252 [Ramicandelaber brevisporus]
MNSRSTSSNSSSSSASTADFARQYLEEISQDIPPVPPAPSATSQSSKPISVDSPPPSQQPAPESQTSWLIDWLSPTPSTQSSDDSSSSSSSSSSSTAEKIYSRAERKISNALESSPELIIDRRQIHRIAEMNCADFTKALNECLREPPTFWDKMTFCQRKVLEKSDCLNRECEKIAWENKRTLSAGSPKPY